MHGPVRLPLRGRVPEEPVEASRPTPPRRDQIRMFEYVRADIECVTKPEIGPIRKLGAILLNPGLHAVLLYRLSRWCHLHHLDPIAMLIGYLSFIVTGAQISRRAVIGNGLTIYHPQGTVIGAGTVLGERCILVHGNTIGQLYGGGDRPAIGDRLYAGAGARILGKITVGHDVRVGANAVVTRSLSDRAVVVADPPKVLTEGRRSAGQSAGFTASRKDILEKVLPLLAEVAGLPEAYDAANESASLLGHGIRLDSIEILSLVSAIEEKLGLTIDESELDRSDFLTVGTVIDFVAKRVSHG